MVTPQATQRRFCVAPMMDYTDRHCRYLFRLISQKAWLYTEMVPTGANMHGDTTQALMFHPEEKPLALQLGGADPEQLAQCARLAEAFDYDEINLNCGCPSPRVREGQFGASLLREPDRVAECITAMRQATSLPVTVKTRIGVDHDDSYEMLQHFVATVAAAGCVTFIIHARKAWLHGLNPKQNREIPPLHYPTVYRLKRNFPDLEFIINGGITRLEAIDEHLARVDGVMLGRHIYQDPLMLAMVDARLYGLQSPAPTRLDILRQLEPYVRAEVAQGTPLPRITRHLSGLFQGRAGARQWRRYLSERMRDADADFQQLITVALHLLTPGDIEVGSQTVRVSAQSK